MNALIYRYGSLCEPSFIDSFRRAGLNVIEETTEITKKNTDGKTLVHNVNSILSENNCLFVFSINFFPALSSVCNIYKIPYISVIVDSPVLELYSNELANPCNHVFTFDSDQYKIFSPYNPGHIHHIPLCADTIGFNKVITSASDNDLQRFSADVSLVGSLYSEKCGFNKAKNFSEYTLGYINGLIETQIDIYGYNLIYDALSDQIVDRIMREEQLYTFPPSSRADYKAVIADELIGVKISEQDRIRTLKYLSEERGFKIDLYTGSDTSMLPKINNRGFAKSLTEMPLIFNRSKINLNITARTIHNGIPQRVFDVLACGGFLISNYQADIPMFFNTGEDLELYSSKEELADKIDFYLKNEDIRQRIALSGYEKVIKYHSTDVRFKELLAATLS